MSGVGGSEPAGRRPAVEVRGLGVRFSVSERAVDDVSFEIAEGEVLGLVGESGSGKSTICRALAGILPPTASVEGEARIHGVRSPLVRLRAGGRGPRIGYVFQSPDATLNPCMRIGSQLTEHLRRMGAPASESLRRATEMLYRMRIPDAAALLERYPHQISGGQQQRVAIAIALLNNPELLILDEPTTSLDVTTQAAILALLEEVLATASIPVLYVSHDVRVVAAMADRVAVMYRGELVEVGPASTVLREPSHPYARALVAAQPDIRVGRVVATAVAANGSEGAPRSTGCRYAPKCPIAEEACLASPIELTTVSDDHAVRCRRAELARTLPVTSADPRDATGARQPGAVYATAEKLGVELGGRGRRQRILLDVDLALRQSWTTAVVGESGAGKTTLARALVGLVPPNEGELTLDGEVVAGSIGRRSFQQVAKLQMVFQSSTASLNPRRKVGAILRRAVRRLGRVERKHVDERVRELLAEVRLPPAVLERKPSQLSGGERQRVAVARALAARPKVLVLDEAVSSLDVSVQAAILDLLKRVQSAEETAFLFISHDLAVVSVLADEVIVLYGGKVVERGPLRAVMGGPHHPYTEVLLRSVPGEAPLSARALRKLDEPIDREIAGCVFATRCPWRIGPVCDEVPPPERVMGSGHGVVCHYESEALLDLAARDRAAASVPAGNDAGSPSA